MFEFGRLSTGVTKSAALAVAFAVGAGAASGQETASSLGDAIANGEVGMVFRYRIETVDQAGFAEDALASVLKSRINFRPQDIGNLGFFFEVDNVSYLGEENFNSTRNGMTQYPLVADPDGTHINQAYVDFKNDSGYVRLGRQRINLDEQRFIGGVAWRQNEQAMDALTVVSNPLDNVDLHYSYVHGVSRIFGPDNGVPTDYYDSSSHLLNAGVNLATGGRLVFYHYALDLENGAAVSNQTTGVRFSQTINRGDLNFPVNVEFARQGDYGDNPIAYDANFTLLEAGVDTGDLRVMLGRQEFGGDQTAEQKMFRTPLATLHRYQGWTDRFLTTPPQGVENTYLALTTRGFAITWHDFNSEATSAHYGSEWDVSWQYNFNDNYNLLLKYATYNPDTWAADVDKLWIQFTASF
ncbi:MAG: alginate export family protein [Gammaproteobacteria bacterium]|nr:alginate export family protein [Gammaproteobacteria bacterium]MCY4296024.1 alginate export family protein [Gammaproteobacteria bacterium]